MPKNSKRILTPLFFCIVVLVILCCSAFAEGETGVPFISINGATPIPWINTIVFDTNDDVVVVSSGICAFRPSIPSGVSLTVNPNVSISFLPNQSSQFLISGTVNNYGTITRSATSSGQRLIEIQSGGVLNCYYGSIVTDEYGYAILVSNGATLNIYGGTISGVDYGVSNSSGSVVNYYSGTVFGDTPFSNVSSVNSPNGSIVIDNGTASVHGDILGSISDFVSTSVSWIGSFVSTIISNNLLLVFVLVVFTGLGIGLLSRLKSI